MANCIIAQPLWLTQTDPRIANIRAWGGFWRPDLPVTNLIDASTGAVARTEDCASAGVSSGYNTPQTGGPGGNGGGGGSGASLTNSATALGGRGAVILYWTEGY